VEIDRERVKEDERYDGKYVLRTTTDLSASEVAEAYRQLTWIERLWRELKDVMQMRPIYHHKKKENVKGHIFGAFLALYLSAILRRRLDELYVGSIPTRTPSVRASRRRVCIARGMRSCGMSRRSVASECVWMTSSTYCARS
jgi:hypothetical protein